jgi:hypothetical protein
MLAKQFFVNDSKSGPIHKMTMKPKNELKNEAIFESDKKKNK